MKDSYALLVGDSKKQRHSRKKPIRIDCFGRLSIYLKGQEMGVAMNSVKARELIAFLMTYHGDAAQKAVVCMALWGDSSEGRGRDNLYKLVKKIRKMPIPFHLECSRSMIQLALDNVESDLITFQRLLHEPRKIENLEQAVALYQGSLYEEENYEWIGMKEAVYDNQYLEALNFLKSYYMEKEESSWVYYYETLMDRYA